MVILDLSTSRGEAVAAELGSNVVFAPTDVSEATQVESAILHATEIGNLSIVVNCAGIGVPQRVVGRAGAHPLDSFERTIKVNLVGTFNVIRLAAAYMAHSPTAEDERGVIVNTASVAAFDGQIGQAAYAASKGAIVGMTLPLARDLAQHKIRVVTIAPGMFLTPLFDSLPEDAIKSLVGQAVHPSRLGEPDEFAQLVLHIIANPMMNGETIRLDGALRMSPR